MLNELTDNGVIAKAIEKMLANRKAMKAVRGQLEAAQAIEEFKAAQANLESAMVQCDTGILRPTKRKDDALTELSAAMQVTTPYPFHTQENSMKIPNTFSLLTKNFQQNLKFFMKLC